MNSLTISFEACASRIRQDSVATITKTAAGKRVFSRRNAALTLGVA
jgi:hypothetical protein